MSILKTMYSAASGLLAHAEAISVASDNIANVNTVGFKSQRARFEDVLEARLLVRLITRLRVRVFDLVVSIRFGPRVR